jgi:hypothetical protein
MNVPLPTVLTLLLGPKNYAMHSTLASSIRMSVSNRCPRCLVLQYAGRCMHVQQPQPNSTGNDIMGPNVALFSITFF